MYSCLEKTHGQRGSWQATVHGGGKELDTTEQLSTVYVQGALLSISYIVS